MVGWVVDRLGACESVCVDVVVAVDMKSGGSVGGIEAVNEPDDTAASKHLNALSD